MSQGDFHVEMDAYDEENVAVAGLNDVITAKKSLESKEPDNKVADIKPALAKQTNKAKTKSKPLNTNSTNTALSLDKAVSLPSIDLLNPAPINQVFKSRT
jgi:hypothetical protein